MNNLERMAKLLLLITREGKFRHSGQNAKRHQSLKGLERFYPEEAAGGAVSTKLRKWIFGAGPASPAHPALAMWLGQAAFIMSRFKKTGQHLYSPIF